MKVVADLSFVTQAAIKRLNLQHRQINRPTDVLSFPLSDFKPGPDGVIRLGDIVICRSQAKQKHHSLPFLIKHAMLHLLGVHHQ
ncbi:MAG: rRNA maturation RNase YbeY [Patescibacteria group bacterium]|nr:rRNA maturation RNase YbeY [Candidatus Beckwithbacteria bacterium]MDZ4229045.1 rRNA maturation RNase YbeY [Patescibacteria group bacterium]